MSNPSTAALHALAQTGLLLLQDPRLPNLVRIVAGETVRGSWWSHPKGRAIFAVLSELADREDVLFVKLVNGKVTLVGRPLWPALVAIASSEEAWQLDGLSEAAREFLATVTASPRPITASGAAVRELERRLLVHAQEVHTDSGRHAIALQTWSRWAKAADVKKLRSLKAAKQQIESAVEAMGGKPSALPWVG